MANHEQLVKTEFHLHTAETSPCGQVPGADIIRALADKGYGGAIVTDHYLSWMFEGRDARTHSLKGFHAAREAGERLGVTVLPGMEFRFDSADNDFLIYGMEERDFASLPDNLWDYTLRDFTAYCHDQGWLVYQAHPFRSWCTPQNPAYLDGAEVFNGNIRQDNNNEKALAFAKKHNLLMIAGGDVHQFVDVRDQGVLVPRSLLTPKGILQFLRENPSIGSQIHE